ncbi:MAG: DUF1295 domain-containing protein [Gammaproteobacteria bacterium]|nr:DUF1295 domain-containing protein [Gammaproteobacteria bacterium]MCP5136344.1 DUF1295 domain-containing protein [Gammaproteobacteria bacterium]
MTDIAFAFTVAVWLQIAVLALASRRWPLLHFWPPPARASWQYRTFWFAFDLMILGNVSLAVLDYASLGDVPTWRHGIGVPLALLGFGLAGVYSRHLGWRNAFGEAGGFRDDGPYRWTRNPIYVVSILGMVGIGISANSAYLRVTLTLWAVLYLAAPLFEEPWLESHYGDAYRRYRDRVRRFL